MNPYEAIERARKQIHTAHRQNKMEKTAAEELAISRNALWVASCSMLVSAIIGMEHIIPQSIDDILKLGLISLIVGMVFSTNKGVQGFVNRISASGTFKTTVWSIFSFTLSMYFGFTFARLFLEATEVL